ncbi:hypothetical protein LOAG_10672 [Loa loa]|uniref:Uncharacterized protein n=1 Tax=Loa loa TaxID=7209 RepID=A0A1S0TPG0_LOALO|nr:hypothetical protein LOAG_10672 [Loa loa]EFO17826.1 hypothetical protein LOAG_10672 [Loa loa]
MPHGKILDRPINMHCPLKINDERNSEIQSITLKKPIQKVDKQKEEPIP